MSRIPVIAIIDIGKTNKKLFLFDEQYKIVFERTQQFDQIPDEDGFPCDDLAGLTRWCRDSFAYLQQQKDYTVKAINFSSFGASFVHINREGKPILPLYSYLKPYPEQLKQRFFSTYGGEEHMSKVTASPALGSLNSGLQLYRLKYEKPEFNLPGYSLHLPQYLSFLVTGQAFSDVTSIGCHTMLWDFTTRAYHEWVSREGIINRLAPIFPSDEVLRPGGAWGDTVAGIGLHDSSSALTPYLASFHQPFVLLSTGTWSISLNPFNDAPLTSEELRQDCLNFMTYQGRVVKASRLFAGHEHEEQTRRLAGHFHKSPDYFATVLYDRHISARLSQRNDQQETDLPFPGASAFGRRNLDSFSSYEEGYHQLIKDIMHQQVRSTNLVIGGTSVTRIFVDGGFGKNQVYMNLLAQAYPAVEVYAASVAQATAMGAALAIHRHWNAESLPAHLIALKFFSVAPEV